MQIKAYLTCPQGTEHYRMSRHCVHKYPEILHQRRNKRRHRQYTNYALLRSDRTHRDLLHPHHMRRTIHARHIDVLLPATRLPLR